jgi:YgiT-type zinc finger domain-containing protein
MKTCPFCKAPITLRVIEHVHRWGGRFYLFRNVRADVCTQCGETFLGPDVLRQMDGAIAGDQGHVEQISIPVIILPDPAAA